MTTVISKAWDRRTTSASLVFDLVDRFARDRGVSGMRPPPQGPVRYRIVATEANNVRTDLPEPLDMKMIRNADGYDLWFGLVDRGETGRSRKLLGARLDRFPEPPPTFIVEIDAERYQREEQEVAALPQPGPMRIELEPGYAYSFPRATTLPGAIGPTLLRGTLRESDGSGIEGAVVNVTPRPAGQPPPNPIYITDATGNWVLPFHDDVATIPDATVQIALAGQPAINVPEVTITQGDTESLRQASVRGGTQTATGMPLPETTITIDLVPGISTRSGADGTWELWLPIDLLPPSGGDQPAVIAATPGQGAAMARGVQVRPRATTSVDPFVFQ